MHNTKAFISTLPDYVEVQRTSFCWFLVYGIREELENFSTILDFTKTTELHIFGQEYKIRKPRYTLLESKQRDGTYSIQVYVPMSLFVFKKDDRNRRVSVLIGEIPFSFFQILNRSYCYNYCSLLVWVCFLCHSLFHSLWKC